jgi:hypothetical protein
MILQPELKGNRQSVYGTPEFPGRLQIGSAAEKGIYCY